MTKKKKNSVVTGRSRVSGAMAGKEGQVGTGPPGPQSAIPQAPSLHGCCPPGSLRIRDRYLNGYLNGLPVFPTFFNLSLNFTIRSS